LLRVDDLAGTLDFLNKAGIDKLFLIIKLWRKRKLVIIEDKYQTP
jgi:hypothetical protein